MGVLDEAYIVDLDHELEVVSEGRLFNAWESFLPLNSVLAIIGSSSSCGDDGISERMICFESVS